MDPGRAQSVDRWVALIAGRAVWADGDERPTAVVRLAAGIQTLMLASSVVTVWVIRIVDESVRPSFAVTWAPAGFTIACVLLAWSPLRILAIRRSGDAGLVRSTTWRIGLVALAIIALFGTAPGWLALSASPFGVALGADAALTSWTLGWHLTPVRSFAHALRSPVHFGILGGLLAIAAERGLDAAVGHALPVYGVFQVFILLACLTVWWLGRLQHDEVEQGLAAADRATSDAHRRSAHWLHDDVCSQLRSVSLRVQRGGVELDEVALLLADLDHTLRLRQLDELLDSGAARLAELVQPYLRRAQAHGATLDEVPSFDQASLIVSDHTGRAFARAAAVLTSNSLNAGSRHLSFSIGSEPGAITLTVVDDAGGFDPDDLPVGRGLWSLSEELGCGALRFHRDGERMSVTAAIPLDADGPARRRSDHERGLRGSVAPRR